MPKSEILELLAESEPLKTKFEMAVIEIATMLDMTVIETADVLNRNYVEPSTSQSASASSGENKATGNWLNWLNPLSNWFGLVVDMLIPGGKDLIPHALQMLPATKVNTPNQQGMTPLMEMNETIRRLLSKLDINSVAVAIQGVKYSKIKSAIEEWQHENFPTCLPVPVARDNVTEASKTNGKRRIYPGNKKLENKEQYPEQQHWTALHKATMTGNYDLVRLLLSEASKTNENKAKNEDNEKLESQADITTENGTNSPIIALQALTEILGWDANYRADHKDKLFQTVEDLCKHVMEGKIDKNLYTEENLILLNDIFDMCCMENDSSDITDVMQYISDYWYQMVRKIDLAERKTLADGKDDFNEGPQAKRPRK